MKSEKLRREESSLQNIFEALKSVPKKRLRIVRDVVTALAEPAISEKEKTKLKHTTRKSLLKTPFCGMWKSRAGITNGQSYARTLSHRLESRGDRA
jgi:plasmid rolling circle replication initiator protein Rep